MGQDPGTSSEAVTTAKEPEQIERDIEETREQLGDTVEALARKTDVKAQAKEKVKDTRATVSAKAQQFAVRAKQASPDSTSQAGAQVSRTARDNPLPLAALAAFAVGFLAGRTTKG